MLGADRYEVRAWRCVRLSGVTPPLRRECLREYGSYSLRQLRGIVRAAREDVADRIQYGRPGGGFEIRDLRTGRVLRWEEVGPWV